MSIGDLLSFVGIVLAIFAFLNEKDRGYIILKFTRLEKCLLLGIFLTIVYLILLDDNFYKRGWYIEALTIKEGFPANVFAFLISLVTVAYILLKILVFPFPQANTEKLISYYEKLMFRGDHIAVIDFIDKHQSAYLCKYLEQRSKDFIGWSKNQHDINCGYGVRHEFDDIKTQSRYSLVANELIQKVISKEYFISNTANYATDFYIKILERYRFPSPYGRYIFKKFVESLIKQKNVLISNSSFQIESWEDAMVNQPYNRFWHLFSNYQIIQYHAITNHIGKLGLKLLGQNDAKAILNSKYDRSINENDLQELEVMEISYVMTQISSTIISKNIRNGKYSNHYLLDYYSKFAERILNILVLKDSYTGYEYYEYSYGLEVINHLTKQLEELLTLSIEEGSVFLVKDIISAFTEILLFVSFKSCPNGFLEEIYSRYIALYSMDEKNQSGGKNFVPQVIRQCISKELTEPDTPIKYYNDLFLELKKQWANSRKDELFTNSSLVSEFDYLVASL